MRNLYKYVAFGVLIITFYACKKELGALPKNAKVDANTILDQGTAQVALNGVYYCFANATAQKNGWGQHQIFPAQLAGYMASYYYFAGAENNQNASLGATYWNESYKLVNAANGVIIGVNALPGNKFEGNRKKEMLAEARFLRAYGHFKLLIYYTEWYKADSPYGVLLRDELSTTGNISKARSTVKESYDFILADLDAAIADGPASNPNYYATKWAAMVLKMRVLISRGTAADYTEIISLAENVKANSPFALEPQAQDIFRTKGLSSSEVILGLKPQALQVTDPYSKSRQYWPGASSLYVALGTLKDLLTDDPRQAWLIGSPNPNTDYVPDTYYFAKYHPENTEVTTVSETDYAIRLTEVYLLEAEAIVRSGGNPNDARALVHEVQAKSGVTVTVNNTSYLAVENASAPDDLLVEIYKETVKSLVGEDGMEWMALLRLPFETVKVLKPTITDKVQYILPIPREEFLYNPAIGDQNPGYNKS